MAAGGTTAGDLGAWICFLDETGQGLRPPKGRSWSRRGHRPQVRVYGGDHGGRVSVAGMVCYRPGERSRADWLRVFYLPAHAPELNPAEGVWSLLKRSMANFSATDLDHLTGMIKHRLKLVQHHPDVINGWLATTGLTLNTTPAITH